MKKALIIDSCRDCKYSRYDIYDVRIKCINEQAINHDFHYIGEIPSWCPLGTVE